MEENATSSFLLEMPPAAARPGAPESCVSHLPPPPQPTLVPGGLPRSGLTMSDTGVPPGDTHKVAAGVPPFQSNRASTNTMHRASVCVYTFLGKGFMRT